MFAACSSSPCLHDGTCILDTSYTFHCACLAGYTGKRCESGESLMSVQFDHVGKMSIYHGFLGVWGGNPAENKGFNLVGGISQCVQHAAGMTYIFHLTHPKYYWSDQYRFPA